MLTGILFVLQSGIPWEMLPQEMGCGSGHELLAQTARPAGSGRDPMGRRAHLHNFKRLRVRFERLAIIHEASEDAFTGRNLLQRRARAARWSPLRQARRCSDRRRCRNSGPFRRSFAHP
ncbi:hypothetical protein MAFF301069_42620 (plasmid) [Ralstonia pseudosolanacearum]|nr:hypothetical protein MAFF301069_42620 [Ralstonia pseudosolanacearum]